ncbi:MAG: acyl carrier protein [Bryobacteraceae bacterium]
MDQRSKIVAIIRQVSGQPVDPSPEQSLFESGLLDSFTLTDLVAELEKQFSIRVPDSDLTPRRFDSVVRIETYLQGRV